MRHHSDIFKFPRRTHVVCAILVRFLVMGRNSIPTRRCTIQIENCGSLAWIRMNHSRVKIISPSQHFSLFPLLECFLHRKYIGQMHMLAINLNSITPWYWNSPRKPAVVANCLLQKSPRINVCSFEQSFQCLGCCHIGKNWVHVIQVMDWYQWSGWMRCQQAKYIAPNIILVDFDIPKREKFRIGKTIATSFCDAHLL